MPVPFLIARARFRSNTFAQSAPKPGVEPPDLDGLEQGLGQPFLSASATTAPTA